MGVMLKVRTVDSDRMPLLKENEVIAMGESTLLTLVTVSSTILYCSRVLV